MNDTKDEEVRRYFYVQYSYTNVYGGTGVGCSAADFKGMLNHREFNSLVKKDYLNKNVKLDSVFILTWVEMSKGDCEEFLRGSGDE